jgi:hypothetical protein
MDYPDIKYKTSIIRILLMIFSITTISALTSFSLNLNFKMTLISAAVYFIIFSAGMVFAVLLLRIPNSVLARSYGFSIIVKSAINGFSFLFPFAIIALLSEYVLNWNAVQAITIAGIFTCVSISVSDLIDLGGRRVWNLVLSLFTSVVFMLMYIIAGTLTFIITNLN